MSELDPEIVDYPRRDEAVRDAIGEEDNPVPLWFNIGFYGGLVFGVIYILFYTLSGWTSLGEYEAQVALAEERSQALRAAMPAANPFSGDAVAIAEGEEVYRTICSACHKPDATGLVGPSLIDPYWKYGNSDEERFESVSEGRPGGMPPWKSLGNEKVWKVLAYLDTLPRSEEPGMGAPDFVPKGG